MSRGRKPQQLNKEQQLNIDLDNLDEEKEDVYNEDVDDNTPDLFDYFNR